MAEFLIRAKKHYMDDYTEEQISNLSDDQKSAFDQRIQIGDVVVVKPDGWQWGKEECLPTFDIIKVPAMSYEEAKKYEQRKEEILVGMLKPTITALRRYKIIDGQIIDKIDDSKLLISSIK